MSLRDLKWSPKEKKIARAAFNKAYLNEMNSIRHELYRKVMNIKESQDVWKIHDYLTEERKQVDGKYDYRYSVLIYVFGRLLREGHIMRDDLIGLSQEKIEAIERLSDIN